MKPFADIVFDAIARKYPELVPEMTEGRRKAQLERRQRQQEREDAARIFHSNPDRAWGLNYCREQLANAKGPMKAQRDPVEAWLDATGMFDDNAETAPTHRAYIALLWRRRQLGKSVRRRLKELGIR